MKFLIALACLVVIAAGGIYIVGAVSDRAEERAQAQSQEAAADARQQQEVAECKTEVAIADAGQPASEGAVRRFGADGIAGYLEVCRGLIKIDGYKAAAN